MRLPWPWHLGAARPAPTPRAARTKPRPAPRLTEADLLRRLDGDASLRGAPGPVTGSPMLGWLRPAVQRLARTAASREQAEAGYRGLRDSALLLGDVVLAGTSSPDFAASLEAIEAYLTPCFPREMAALFPALLVEAERLHRERASSSAAAARLGAVFDRAFATTA